MALVKTQDGSFTLFNKSVLEHYHSLGDGALFESMQKHVLPALDYFKGKDELRVFDPFFGLGYLSLCLVASARLAGIKKLSIVACEIDTALLKSLLGFPYPQALLGVLDIFYEILRGGSYRDSFLDFTLHNADVFSLLPKQTQGFDLIFFAPFSQNRSANLWMRDKILLFANLLNRGGLLTTYSQSVKIQSLLQEAGLKTQKIRRAKRPSLLAFKP
ncbi:MAG: MnmC family methyltransferase [Helicobacteraceae bacterium]